MSNKSGNLLERYTGRGENAGVGDGIAEIEDLGAFGCLRGMHERSIMVELRRRTGETMALAYGYVDRIHYEPAEGITLHCGSHVIRVRGRSLNREILPNVTLFQGLTRARVPWIAEADEASALRATNGVVIDAIEWD